MSNAATTTAPPQKAPPPAPSPVKKKKGGCLFRLILLLLIAGAAAAVYYYPSHVEKLTGMQIPAFVPSAAKAAAKQVASTAPAKSAKTATSKANTSSTNQTATTRYTPANQTPASTATEAQLHQQVAQLQQQAAVNAQQLQAVVSRLARAEQQLAQVTQQQSAQNQFSAATENRALRLRVVALQLRVDGNTAAAAQQLRVIAAATADLGLAGATTDEATRLQNIPARATLLSIIDAALAPAEEVAEQAEQGTSSAAPTEPAQGIAAKLKSLFNVRYTPAASVAPHERELLQQLRQLLHTGQEDAYWNLLQQHTGDSAANTATGTAAETLQRLHNHGAPDYQVRIDQLL